MSFRSDPDPNAKRSHFAIKFAAGVMRVASVLVIVGGFFGALGSAQGTFRTSTLPEFSGLVSVIVIAVSLIYALILWGFADALVLLADTYDAQLTTQKQMAALLAEPRAQRSESPPQTLPR